MSLSLSNSRTVTVTRFVKIRALKSFGNFREGYIGLVLMTEQVAHLIVNGYLACDG